MKVVSSAASTERRRQRQSPLGQAVRQLAELRPSGPQSRDESLPYAGAVRRLSTASELRRPAALTGLSGLIFLGQRPAEPVLCESQGSDLVDETDPASCVGP